MIYCDLVGVLLYQTGRHGFANMPWTRTGRKLWDFIKGEKPILVSECRMEGYDEIYRQLREWIDRELGEYKLYCFQDGVPKSDTCKGGDILIDDNHKVGREWIEKGGTFIHFLDADQAIKAILESRE